MRVLSLLFATGALAGVVSGADTTTSLRATVPPNHRVASTDPLAAAGMDTSVTTTGKYDPSKDLLPTSASTSTVPLSARGPRRYSAC